MKYCSGKPQRFTGESFACYGSPTCSRLGKTVQLKTLKKKQRIYSILSLYNYHATCYAWLHLQRLIIAVTDRDGNFTDYCYQPSRSGLQKQFSNYAQHCAVSQQLSFFTLKCWVYFTQTPEALSAEVKWVTCQEYAAWESRDQQPHWLRVCCTRLQISTSITHIHIWSNFKQHYLC